MCEASTHNVQLPRYATKELSEKKLKSLLAEYFSIPRSSPTESTVIEGKCKPGRLKQKRGRLKANQLSILRWSS
ncbi:Hypothetical protein PHPALM_20030 [Phytophthora palmivora]|uniref:Uncharacterized protein n=1 Tax=Phytophthora palmivora TaxID=4796 RepID=A0A2P4XFV0_9STRA|nr:Hypothetical protein PHPALM_20030 [Phytophthora palmivora]